jgi:Prophage tail length tape measure protein
MAAKNVDIRINTTADTQGAKQATVAMQGLNTATKQATTTANAATVSTGKLGQKAGAVGLQIQDVAVQAQAGTSAITILAQQGSQIAGIFGPGGALVAVGAVAAKVFYDMAVSAAVSGEAMEDMSGKLKDAFGSQAKKLIDAFNESLEVNANRTDVLRNAEQSLFEVRNLREETDAKLIKSQLALDEAAIKYLATTGQLVDEESALLAVRNQAAAEESQALIDASLAQVENERRKYDIINQSKQDVDDDVRRAQEKLAELENQQSELRALANISKEDDSARVRIGTEKDGFKSVKTQALQGQIDGIQKQIENVYKVIEGAPLRIEEITTQAMSQAAAVDVAIAQSKAEIDRIQTEYDLAGKAQTLNIAAQSITQDAAAITKEIATIEAITPVQQEAKAAIQKAAADGVITAQEQVEIGRNLSVLLAGMKTGQTEQLKTVRDLILLNNDMAIKMGAMNKEIDGLRERVKAIPIR